MKKALFATTAIVAAGFASSAAAAEWETGGDHQHDADNPDPRTLEHKQT